MKPIAFALTIAVHATLLPLAAAQTTNISGFNEMTVNGLGAGGASCINAYLPVPGTGNVTLAWDAQAGAPVVLAVAAGCAPGSAVVGPNNSLDLSFSSFQVVLDGTGAFLPSWFSTFFHTSAAGALSFTVPNAVTAIGTAFSIQSALVHPAYGPSGIQLSAGFSLVGIQDPFLSTGNATSNPNATVLAAGDDTAVLNALGWSFPFYGLNHTQGYVCSNGFVSFGAPYSHFAESVAGLSAPPARACAYWDDFFVGGGVMPAHGTLSFFTDPQNQIAEWCWSSVPEFPNTGNNSFKITLLGGANPRIVYDYGYMDALDGLVGITGGGPVSSLINLSAGAANGLSSPASAYYEIFSGLAPAVNDLAGLQVTFNLDAAGNPIGMQ